MFKNESAYITVNNKTLSMKKIIRYMGFLSLFLFGSYIVLTGQTIYNIVNQKNIEQDIRNTRSSLAGLENTLFSYYNGVHKDSLEDYGFVAYTNERYLNQDTVVVFNR